MWVFFPYGFFSVVKVVHGDDCGSVGVPNYYVRSRIRGHLEMLLKRHRLLIEIRETPDNDYRFRIVIPANKWALVCATESREIQCANFKKEAGFVASAAGKAMHGAEYLDALHRVWMVMNGMQESIYPRPFDLPGQKTLEFDKKRKRKVAKKQTKKS